MNDLTGERYGRLMALTYVGVDKNRNSTWLCECTCGKTTIVSSKSLRSGNTRSCGCLKLELLVERSTKHRLCNHPLYTIWQGLKLRCYCPGATKYKDWGGRGIKMCNEWREDFLPFFRWAEPLWSQDLQIDREDNDGDYTPDNCRFVTGSVNCMNRRVKSTNTTGYTGVHPHKSKFQVAIAVNKKNTYVGIFNTIKEAVSARNNYIKNHGLPYKIQAYNE